MSRTPARCTTRSHAETSRRSSARWIPTSSGARPRTTHTRWTDPRGSDAIAQNLFARLATEWDGFTVNPKEFHDVRDTVIVEVRYTGTHKETGKDLDAQAVHVFGFRDGKVASFQQYVDTAQLQDAIGAR
jgi:ketosteroid isomerase-like protein